MYQNENYITKAREEGIHLQNYSIGQQKITCPKCSHNRKNKFDRCLSVNIDTDHIKWRCHHCEWEGGFNNQFSNSQGQKGFSNDGQIAKTISKPKIPTIKKGLSDEAIEWLASRRISKQTADAFELYTHNQKLCFPYLLDGDVVNVKERTKDKVFTQMKGAIQSIYNIDRLKKHWDTQKTKELIFVEGEMDVIALYECGYENVVSLKDGASKTAKYDDNDRRFKALENSDFIFDAEEITICTDQDEAGKALQLELIYRFGKDICKVVSFPQGIKDSNECLIKLGKEKVREFIDGAKPFPIEGLHGAKEYKQAIQDIYEGKVQKVFSTGLEELDQIYKVMPTTFNLITGIPNHGKSNFLDQILMNLAEKYGWKFVVYSPEHSTPNHIRRLSEKRVRKPFDIGMFERISQDELDGAIDFIDNHFKFIENTDEIPTIDFILKKCKSAKQRFGVNGLVIDPFNQISPERSNNKREDEHIRDIIVKCQQFARNHQMVVWMVAHPHKLHRNDSGVIPPPDLYQVSGSAHWANLCDVGLVVHRDFEVNTTQIITRKIREQGVYGNIGQCEFLFNMKTRCYE